jgi:hypothetical protein
VRLSLVVFSVSCLPHSTPFAFERELTRFRVSLPGSPPSNSNCYPSSLHRPPHTSSPPPLLTLLPRQVRLEASQSESDGVESSVRNHEGRKRFVSFPSLSFLPSATSHRLCLHLSFPSHRLAYCTDYLTGFLRLTVDLLVQLALAAGTEGGKVAVCSNCDSSSAWEVSPSIHISTATEVEV